MNSLHAQQEIVNDSEKTHINAIDTAIKRLKDFKECLTGKKPCTKLDFAALTAIMLYVYGMVLQIRAQLVPITAQDLKEPWSALSTREQIGKVATYINPAYWGSRTIQRPIEEYKKYRPTTKR